MLRYATLLLAAVAVGCSDKPAETATRAAAPVAVMAPAADSVRPARSIVPQAVALAAIPVNLRLPGKLLEGWRWQDGNGENLLVVFRSVTLSQEQLAAQAQLAAVPDPSAIVDMRDLERSAQLSARQYVRRPGGQYTELWRLQDIVDGCPLDLTLQLRPGSTAITDLDRDGRSETTLLYALACRSDVSGAALKLIMRAGANKYALRGSTVVQYDSVPATARQPANPCCLDQLSKARREAGNVEGYYHSEAEFRAAPPAFLRFARQQWQKFSVETMEQHEEL